jgi:hypothetical protein
MDSGDKTNEAIIGTSGKTNEAICTLSEAVMDAVCVKSTRKHGSDLSKTDFNWFEAEPYEIGEMIPSELMSHALLDEVTSLVHSNFQECKGYSGTLSSSEFPFVQGLSTKLIGKIASLFDSSFQVQTKSTDQSKIDYGIEIHNPSDSAQKVFISGQTDEAVYYQETCLLPWEDKNLSLTKFTEQNLAQIFSQVKYFAGKFKKNNLVEPPVYIGVLTNGLVWSFVCRFYVDGDVLLKYTKAITLETDESSFELVAAALIACFINCQRLRDVRDTQIRALASKLSNMHIGESNLSGDDNCAGEGSDDDGHDDTAIGARHVPFSNLSLLSSSENPKVQLLLDTNFLTLDKENLSKHNSRYMINRYLDIYI